MAVNVAFRRLPPRVASPRSLAPFAALPTTSTGRRSFFSFPSNDVQNLVATRTLPYGRDALYDLIADVDSYELFVPYCSHSRVTKWSPPDVNGRKWPVLADLHVGWAGFNEDFTSRLRCVPGVSVEAVSGNLDGSSQASPVFKSLTTRWSLKPSSSPPTPSTEVHLSIEYKFVNPLYATISSAVSEKVAGMMVEAFEKQARHKLGPSRHH